MQSKIASNPDFEMLFQVAARSVQMVKKTRAAASRASVKRAREIPADLGIHPLAAGSLDLGKEAERASLLSQLGGFRPHANSMAVGAPKKSKPGDRFGGAKEKDQAGVMWLQCAGEEEDDDDEDDDEAENDEEEGYDGDAVGAAAAAAARQKPRNGNKAQGGGAEPGGKKRKRAEAVHFQSDFFMGYAEITVYLVSRRDSLLTAGAFLTGTRSRPPRRR